MKGQRVATAALAVMITVVVSAHAAGADRADDRATADRALLEPDDLRGDGWKSSPNSSADDPPLPADPSCDGLRRAERTAERRSVDGPDFARTDEVTLVEYSIEETVVVFGSARVARRYFDAYVQTDALACFEADVGAPPKGEGPYFLPRAVREREEIASSGVGDEAIGYFLEADVTFGGEPAFPIAFEATFVRVGRAVVHLSLSTSGEIQLVPDGEDIVRAAVDKVNGAL